MTKLLSRKFIAMLAVVLVALAAVLTGEMAMKEAVWFILPAVLAYLGVEGAADIITRARTK